METLLLTNLSKAVDLLKQKELVAFPTETVYGLGALIFCKEAIQKIFLVKNRPQDNPLIAHIHDVNDCYKLAKNIPKSFFTLAEAFFPGPLTLIVKKRREVPQEVSAQLDTVAIRMPQHPLALELIKLAKEPLVAPSANLSGRPSSTKAEHVLADFNGKIAAIIDGGICQHGMESTVIDLVSFEKPTLLRHGALSKEVIEEVLNQTINEYTKGVKSSPGMKYRHYAPNLPVKLFSDVKQAQSYLALSKKALVLTTVSAFLGYPLEQKTLYSYLRLAEQEQYEEVVIICPGLEDATLANRLQKIIES